LSRWEAGGLSMMEAGELLGMSERQFRRYRERYEEEGVEGLRDRRVGKPSPKRVPAAEAERMLALYGCAYLGWNVKHFHEHLRRDHGFRWGYTWVKTQLHTAGLVERAARRGAHRRKRERKPCEGMMLHQDGSRAAWLAGQPQLDLIVTMDDATSTLYSAFLVEEEGTASSFRGLLEVFTTKGLPSSLYTDRGSHYFFTRKAGEAVDRSRPTQVGRALERLGIEHIPAYSPEARGRSERPHYVKARVRVHEYPDGTFAVFHGPRRLARYSAQGTEIAEGPTAASLTPCSPPSRPLRAASGGGLRPALTALAASALRERRHRQNEALVLRQRVPEMILISS
jgi:transposase